MKAILNYNIKTREDLITIRLLVGLAICFLLYLASVSYVIIEYFHNSPIKTRHIVAGMVAYHLHRKKIMPFIKYKLIRR